MTGGRRKAGVAIPAAGTGERMGGGGKAFLTLAGEPLLARSLHVFLSLPEVVAVAVALHPDDAEDPPPWLTGLDGRVRVVAGGESRFHSVLAALTSLPDAAEVALVHDAARPLVTREIILRCLEAVREGAGAVAGWPAVDTIKEVDDTGFVTATPDRGRLWQAQTPQAFPRLPLLEAYRRAADAGTGPTDDSAVFQAAGGRVRMVEGSPWNLKVTHPEDLAVAELLLEKVG